MLELLVPMSRFIHLLYLLVHTGLTQKNYSDYCQPVGEEATSSNSIYCCEMSSHFCYFVLVGSVKLNVFWQRWALDFFERSMWDIKCLRIYLNYACVRKIQEMISIVKQQLVTNLSRYPLIDNWILITCSRANTKVSILWDYFMRAHGLDSLFTVKKTKL